MDTIDILVVAAALIYVIAVGSAILTPSNKFKGPTSS